MKWLEWLVKLVLSAHIHSWEITREAEYATQLHAKWGIPTQRKRRVCRKCGKIQELEIHMLGVHPVKYNKHWFTIPQETKVNRPYKTIW